MRRWLMLGLALVMLLGACGRYGRPVRAKQHAPALPAASLSAAEVQEPSPAEAAEDDEEE